MREYDHTERLFEYIENNNVLELHALVQSFEIEERANLLQTYFDTVPHGMRQKTTKVIGEMLDEGAYQFCMMCMQLQDMVEADDEIGIMQILDESSQILEDFYKERVDGLENYKGELA